MLFKLKGSDRHLRRDRLGRHGRQASGDPGHARADRDAAIEAAQAGAAIAHIHVRDPATGKAARRLDLYREVVERVRASGVDVVLNLTAGMGGDFVPDAGSPGAAGRAPTWRRSRTAWRMSRSCGPRSARSTAAA